MNFLMIIKEQINFTNYYGKSEEYDYKKQIIPLSMMAFYLLMKI